MLLFNDIIQHLDLVEISLKDRAYTWSNMQANSLLEKLDWVFTSPNWTLMFSNTMAYALAHSVLDHVPYVVQMESGVPKSTIFMFVNHWVTHPEFSPTIQHLWSLPIHRGNATLVILAKLKSLHKGLKAWCRELSKLNKLINYNSFVMALLDGLEEQRPLSVLKIHLISL
jgi:hypothetical protein